MSTYYTVPGVDTGVRCTANSADVQGNIRVRLAVGGEAGILVEQEVSEDAAPEFVAMYFPAEHLDTLIEHLAKMRKEYAKSNDAA